jgi:DNA-binding transcriptional ArsR family regulator
MTRRGGHWCHDKRFRSQSVAPHHVTIVYQIVTRMIVESEAEREKSISRQAVSQYLDPLERAGMVTVSWSGRTKLHSLDLRLLRDAANVWFHRHLQ